MWFFGKKEKIKEDVLDAAKAPNLHVEVTQEFIDSAIRKHSSHCMVADAIRDQYPQYTHVAVNRQMIGISDKEKGLRYIYLTPIEVGSHIYTWDDTDEIINPFTFQLKGSKAIIVKAGHRDKSGTDSRRLRPARKDNLNNQHKPQVIGGSDPIIPISKERVGGWARRFAPKTKVAA